MTRFRNSQLRQIRACPFAYAERYVHGKQGQPSPALEGGRHVHDAIALAVKEVVAGGPWLDVHQLAFRAVRGGTVEYAAAVEILTSFTESLTDEDFEIDPRAVFVLERQLEMALRLWNGEEVVFFGTPDLAERTGKRRCRITDWKSHWRPESQEEFRADQQLKRYALLISEAYPAFEEFELVKRFVRYRRNSYSETITRDDLVQVRHQLISEIQAAREIEERGEFPATGGEWCGLCEFHASCPVIAKWRELGIDEVTIDSDARASELAGAAIAMDAAAGRLKDRLKRYLGDEHLHGAVPVAGGFYGYGTMEKREAALEDVRAAFDKHGTSIPDQVLRIDLDELDRLQKRLPEALVQSLRSAVKTKQGAQCRFHRTPKTKKASPQPAVVAGEMELL